jgi:hypothetical protein
VAAAKRQLEITQREYNRAHGFTPASINHTRAGPLHRRGSGLGVEINRDGGASPAASLELRVYNTPEKNVLAAEAAAEELSLLEGEDLRRHTKRLSELLRAATLQQKDPRYAGNAPSNSLAPNAAGHSKSGPRDTAE